MRNHQSVTVSILSSWKVLAVLLIAATSVHADLSPDEIKAALVLAAPNVYCGKRITTMMAYACNPEIRRKIEGGQRTVKKSRK